MFETHTISRYEGEVRWIPVKAAAGLLGVSTERVYQLIKAGALVSITQVHTVLVAQRSVDARNALREREKEGANADR